MPKSSSPRIEAARSQSRKPGLVASGGMMQTAFRIPSPRACSLASPSRSGIVRSRNASHLGRNLVGSSPPVRSRKSAWHRVQRQPHVPVAESIRHVGSSQKRVSAADVGDVVDPVLDEVAERGLVEAGGRARLARSSRPGAHRDGSRRTG